jgi:hypothetical protein
MARLAVSLVIKGHTGMVEVSRAESCRKRAAQYRKIADVCHAPELADLYIAAAEEFDQLAATENGTDQPLRE